MARNCQTIDYREDYYKGFSSLYFNSILKTIINLGELQDEKNIILDYGCGVGHLKKRLNKPNVIGYDIVPELSEIDDYKKIIPHKIVLSGVLEHLYLNEIEDLLKSFLNINSKAILLVYLPTENFVSKIAMVLAGQSNAHDDHVSSYKDINKIVSKYYYPEKQVYKFFSMAQVTKYVPLNR